MIIFKYAFVFMLFFSFQALAIQEKKTVTKPSSPTSEYLKVDFSSLTAHVEYEEMDDPFWELEYDVLDKLAVIVDYVDAKTAGEAITKQQTQEHDSIKAELIKQKIDVDGLLEIRQKMIALWRSQNESTNPDIVNKKVEIQGFVLPIEWQGKKLSEFLLVPYVGACIHQPAPPPNQVVYAKLSTPISFPQLETFASVTVKGQLISEMQSPNLTLVDDTQPVATSYELKAISVEIENNSMSEF